jgi:ABC-type glycerol-3-phosphate transport system substrate-binding protein
MLILRMMPRKICALLLALLALPTGCERRESASPPGGPVVIQYWEKWTGFEADAMREIVEDFNASQSRIRVNFLSVSGLDTKLMLATAGGNPPDVSGLYAYLAPIYAENNALTPLDGLMEGSGLGEETYIPAVWQSCRHRGFTWALPTTPATLALYWNKKLFLEAGLSAPPKTLAELEEMNDKLLRRDSKGRILQLGHSPQEPGWWNALWVGWFGGYIQEPGGALGLDSAPMRATFDWLRTYPERFGGDDLSKLRNGFGNFASPQNPFFTGRIAMTMQGPWLHNFIGQYAPEGFEWGVAPFPSADGNLAEPVTLLEADVLVIPKGAAHPREAFEFIQYVNSQAALEKLCLKQQKFSPRRVVSEGFYRAHANPDIRTFYDLAASPRARVVPQLRSWMECRNDLNSAVDSVMLQGAAAKVSLPALQKKQTRVHERDQARWERVAEKRLAEWRALVEETRP